MAFPEKDTIRDEKIYAHSRSSNRLGKDLSSGSKTFRSIEKKPIKVLFLVPSIPLGVQQTLFARNNLGIEAFMVSGGISPRHREQLRVWNNAFVVTTPQTFYNDNLAKYEMDILEAKTSKDPIEHLTPIIKDFPFDTVVADECQRYIGETKGYSILLAARASGARILALSATPQLHSTHRLGELKRIFNIIRIFKITEPEIEEHMPERLLVMEQLDTPKKLMRLYKAFGDVIQAYNFRISKIYGKGHPRNCTQHPICGALMAIRMLRMKIIEDGASSAENYKTWKFKDLQNKRASLDGDTIQSAYSDALIECHNHKLDAAVRILSGEVYNKAIVYVESVEAAKQITISLQKKYGMQQVACLVGKGNMSMDQQASALFHFKEKAKILVCTSIGEEGLDIPSADFEIWISPPSNPVKWIQRFGRILRQPGDKKTAKTIALISKKTHEKR